MVIAAVMIIICLISSTFVYFLERSFSKSPRKEALKVATTYLCLFSGCFMALGLLLHYIKFF